MRVRDLFVLVVKLVAISLLIHVFIFNVPSLFMQIWMNSNIVGVNGIELVQVFLLSVLLIVLFVFAGKIVDFLQVEKGFANPTLPTTTLTLSGLTELGIFLVGLLLIVDNLPSFLSNALFWFKAKAVDNPYEYVQTGNYWFVSLFSLIIGYVLISNKGKFAKSIIPK